MHITVIKISSVIKKRRRRKAKGKGSGSNERYYPGRVKEARSEVLAIINRHTTTRNGLHKEAREKNDSRERVGHFYAHGLAVVNSRALGFRSIHNELCLHLIIFARKTYKKNFREEIVTLTRPCAVQTRWRLMGHNEN